MSRRTFPNPRTCPMLGAAIAVAVAGTVASSQPGAPGGLDLSGRWTLNTYLSDNPEQVAASIQFDFGLGGPDRLPDRGSEPGRFGRRGGGRGEPQGTREGSRGASRDQPSQEELNRLNELTEPVRYPLTTMVVSQKPDAVTFTDAQGQARTVATTGKREKQTIGASTIDVTSRWEGPQLISEEDLGKGRKMIFTYSAVPPTKQLLLRIALERAPGQRGPFEIKYLYDRASAP